MMNKLEEQPREYLLNIPLWTKKKNTLSQVRDFLRELGSPQKRLNIIHVAGTNGKGSVCADLTAILKKAGYRTGTFISPHLVDVRERFLLDGELVSEEGFARSFYQVLAVVKTMTGRGYCHPTFFEFCFLMAMVLFAEEKVEYCILETGMGGRLDTTNVIARPLACVITSISLDHTQYLGNTIREIAGEKAGIIKAGVPVIYDDNNPEASAVIAARAKELGAPAFPVSEKLLAWAKTFGVGRRSAGAGNGGIGEGGCDVRAGEYAAGAEGIQVRAGLVKDLPFVAPYQAMNAALALTALTVLKLPRVDDEVCRAGLQEVRWPGRMEEVRPGIWLDGAHNPGGIRAFINAVRISAGQERVHLLFAAVSDKDYREMIRMLCEGLPIERVTVAHLDSERGTDQAVLAAQFRQAGCPVVEQYPTVDEALSAALAHKRPDGRLYVVGSLYLIGEIKKRLSKP